jgi:hypothetical protein
LPIVLPPWCNLDWEAAPEPAEAWWSALALRGSSVLLLPYLLPDLPGSFLY